MSIKKITLENYKCFSDKTEVFFSVPDTKINGAGLNILVGENNSGKTAVLSSIYKLKKGIDIEMEEKFEGNDVQIIFEDNQGNTKIIKNKPSSSLIEKDDKTLNFTFEDGVQYIKDVRIWNSNFSGEIDEKDYSRSVSIKRQEIDSSFSQALAKLENEPSQKEVLDEFNTALKKVIPSFKKWTTQTSKGIRYITYEMLNGKSQDIDFALGSGILNLFRILFGVIVNTSAKVVVIDEPEVYLHPLAQEALSDILIKKSKDKQIILATHSPYIFRKPIQNSINVLLFKRQDDIVKIIPLNKEFGLLGSMSPTYAEISFHAYGLYTPEFHNELYGFIHSKFVKDGKIKDVDEYLISKGDKNLVWKRDDGKDRYKGLSTYIRNYIHHPDQKGNNRKYTDEELRESIEFLIKCLTVTDSS